MQKKVVGGCIESFRVNRVEEPQNEESWDEVPSSDKLDRLNVMHYKLLRIIIKDWCRLYPREMLDTLGRIRPWNFAKYAFA